MLGTDACAHPGGGEEGRSEFDFQVHLREGNDFMVFDTSTVRLWQ